MDASDRDLRREFVERLHEHQRIVHKVCAVYAGGPEEREDLFQEIAVQLWRAYPSFRGDSSFATWAYRVALNTALFRRRSAAARPREKSSTEVGEIAATSPGPEGREGRDGPGALEVREDVRLLHECIRELRELDRAIVLLHLEGRPHAEIASVTGLSTGNVDVRVHRIKRTLRERLLARGYVER